MPVIGLMLSTLVFDLAIYALMNIYAELIPHYLHAYIGAFNLMESDFEIAGIPGILIVSAATTSMLVLLFQLILTKTKFGIAMRAVMESHSLAIVHGVNTELVLSVSWFFVGGIAGISGSLYPIWFYVDPWAGATMFISIFAACVVGGLRSIYGSLLGGFLIAVSQNLISFTLASVFGPALWAYSSIWSILIAALVVLKMPEGISGFITSRK
jgi:branched-chain amino acid transport system permease protein